MLAYQTVSMCEGLTALPSDIGSCVWPSHERERGDIFLRSFLLQAGIFSLANFQWSYREAFYFLTYLFQPLSNAVLPFICCWDLFKCLIKGARPRWETGPTVLSTRTKPRLEGRPSRSASQKIWSSAGWRAREESAVWFSVISIRVQSFLISVVAERERESTSPWEKKWKYHTFTNLMTHC